MLSRLLLFLLLCTFGLYAIEGGISVTVVEKEKHFISEEVLVKVDLKSTAFSIKNVKVGLENSNDYIVLAPTSAASLETIDINNTDWQIVHYEYKLYPLHAGEITVPVFSIGFQASMGYGQPEEEFSFKSEPISLEVEAPKGVSKEMFVLSTPKYTVQSHISTKMSEGNITQIKVGDAVTLKIVQEAKNVPDILLRPIFFKESNQYKIYAEEPALNTKEQGKGILASRTDTYTLVATKEGNITIPSQVFMWWLPKEEVLYKEVTEAYSFSVLPSPNMHLNEGTLEKKRPFVPWSFIIFSLLLLSWVFYKLYPSLKQRREERTIRYQQSEEGRYDRLMETMKDDNLSKLYQDFYCWLEVASPTLSRSGFRGIEEVQPTFGLALQELEAALVTTQQSFDKTDFINELTKFREVLREQQQVRVQGLPDNINPIF